MASARVDSSSTMRILAVATAAIVTIVADRMRLETPLGGTAVNSP